MASTVSFTGLAIMLTLSILRPTREFHLSSQFGVVINQFGQKNSAHVEAAVRTQGPKKRRPMKEFGDAMYQSCQFSVGKKESFAEGHVRTDADANYEPAPTDLSAAVPN